MILKLLAYDTNVLLSNGLFKKVQDLTSNDILCGENNNNVKIINIDNYECNDEMCNFIVIPKIGNNFYLYGYHSIPVYFNNTKTVIPLYEFYNFFNKDKNVFLYSHCYDFDFPNDDIFMDPYLLGIWLSQCAQGYRIQTNCIRIYLSHSFIENYIGKIIKKFNLQYNLSSDYIDILDDKFLSVFKNYNLLENLHIPLPYKTSVPKIRIILLSALCDILGVIDKDSFVFEKILNKNFLNDCCFLLNSLGFQTSIFKDKIKVFSQTIFSIPMIELKKENKNMLNFVHNYFQVAPINEKKYFSIQLSQDSNILLDDFTVV
jgi:hypothetical protein